MRKENKPKPGDFVLLTKVPPGLLEGLPLEDQRAIRAVVGKPILLSEYDKDGRLELEFTDRKGTIHFIYVQPSFVSMPRRPRRARRTNAD